MGNKDRELMHDPWPVITPTNGWLIYLAPPNPVPRVSYQKDPIKGESGLEDNIYKYM